MSVRFVERTQPGDVNRWYEPLPSKRKLYSFSMDPDVREALRLHRLVTGQAEAATIRKALRLYLRSQAGIQRPAQDHHASFAAIAENL